MVNFIRVLGFEMKDHGIIKCERENTNYVFVKRTPTIEFMKT